MLQLVVVAETDLFPQMLYKQLGNRTKRPALQCTRATGKRRAGNFTGSHFETKDFPVGLQYITDIAATYPLLARKRVRM